MPVTAEQLRQFTTSLRDLVSASQHPETLPQVAAHLAEALRETGLPVDRLQLPLSSLFGLKHPIYAGIILTWTAEGGSTAWLRSRTEVDDAAGSLETLRNSPFGPVALDGRPYVRMRVGEERWRRHALLRRLETEGYVDHLATATELPGGARQVISVATRHPDGLGNDVLSHLSDLMPVLALALYGIYQAQTSFQIATTYLGQHTGRKVMAGTMGRGRSEALHAAIAFIDVRDFTRLSNANEITRIISLLNTAFEAIDEALRPLGGEVLKFMGDAALVVFPHFLETNTTPMDLIDALLSAVEDVEARTSAQGQAIRLGVGLHVGDVLYGNVGAKGRHDFTVMGPAVNLASRLEGLTKQFDTELIVSEAVAALCRRQGAFLEQAKQVLRADIRQVGPVPIKGEPAPISVWSITRRDGSAPGDG